MRQRWPFLGERTAKRMARAYGTRIAKILGVAGCASELGQNFGAGLSAREVDYLVQHEWARSADDILWRRSKLGYRMSNEQVAALNDYVRSLAA